MVFKCLNARFVTLGSFYTMTTLADKFASRLAQLTPFGKRNDDPLASIKTATRWLEALPIGDAFKCQEAILNEIKRFNETQYTKDRLAVFMLLDVKSRDLQDTLVRQYLRNPRMSRPVESQLWHAVYGLYWEIARGYHTFVLQLTGAPGNIPREELIPLISLRAIRTVGQLLKWRAIRYLPAGEKLWLRLHNLYRIAETEGFHRQAQRAYADETADCSCETASTWSTAGYATGKACSSWTAESTPTSIISSSTCRPTMVRAVCANPIPTSPCGSGRRQTCCKSCSNCTPPCRQAARRHSLA
jgi:hypothetical protein